SAVSLVQLTFSLWSSLITFGRALPLALCRYHLPGWPWTATSTGGTLKAVQERNRPLRPNLYSVGLPHLGQVRSSGAGWVSALACLRFSWACSRASLNGS